PPGRGIEERDDSEGARHGVAQAAPDAVAGRQLRLRGHMRVEEEVGLWDERALPPVGDAPVDEEGPLVLRSGGGCAVVRPQVARLAPAKAKLGLPPGEVRVDEEVRPPYQAGSAADDKGEPPVHALDAGAEQGQLPLVEERRQREIA